MNRREFVAGLSSALVGTSSFHMAAQCVRVGPGVSGCRLGLASHFKIVKQNCDERCWAASIAGIFGYHDHPISQNVIATTVFGSTACQGSGGPDVLNAVLNHEWTDSNGDKFSAKIKGLYDPLNGAGSIDNNDLIAEMRHDNPVLYCNLTHCIVIVGLDYRKDSSGDLIAIDQVHVADPFHDLGFHTLSNAEMRPEQLGGSMTYLASIDVD